MYGVDGKIHAKKRSLDNKNSLFIAYLQQIKMPAKNVKTKHKWFVGMAESLEKNQRGKQATGGHEDVGVTITKTNDSNTTPPLVCGS